MGRFVTILVLSTLLVACQNTATPAAPSPSPTPHTAVTAATLQAADVPAGLTICPGSGRIAPYLLSLQVTAPEVASRMSDEWQQLRAEGAVDAAISLFAANPAACTAEMAVTPNAKAAAGFVAVFADQGQAERAWESGVLGFVPLAPGQLTPGIVRGTGTGLGTSAWTYNRPPVQLASWRRSIFVSLLVLTNLDPTTFQAATAAIDARLN